MKPKSRVCYMALGLLKDGASYQRPVDTLHVARLVNDFDPEAIGVFSVSERANGTYWKINGQHRGLALQQIFPKDWKDQRVPCHVYSGISIEDEARIFKKLNDDRSVHPFDNFRARLVAKEAAALDITRIVRGAGFPLSADRSDSFAAVVALDRVYKGFRAANSDGGPARLNTVMTLLAESWGTERPYPAGEIVTGLGLFLERFGNDVDMDTLRHKLSSFPGGWTGVIGKARGWRDVHGGALSRCICQVVRGTYNQFKRSGALPEL